MIYYVEQQQFIETKIEKTERGKTLVGCLTLEEFQKHYERFGVSEQVVEECKQDTTHFRTSIDVYKNYSFGIVNILQLRDVQAPRDRIAFVISDRLFLLIQLVDEDNSVAEMLRSVVARPIQRFVMERFIAGVFEKLLNGGARALEDTEKQMMELEEALTEGNTDVSMNKQIFRLRNQLTLQHTYYEQLIDIGDELLDNENDIFNDDELMYFKNFNAKAERLSVTTQTLCDNMVHVREALDAALNYTLNSIMKVFTVVTTIFLPLTLIVGWYGMNFTTMPELTWKYGYLAVIALSILVIIGCGIFFKRKKLF